MYTVVLNGVNLAMTINAGDIVPFPNGIMIENIPIGQPLTFDIWDTDLFCVVSGNINPPNCDCPSVPAPVSLGNRSVCFGSPIPPLEVSVTPGTIAHWYDAASGGNLLASDVLSFTPTATAVGTYTYFVEAESIEYPGCVSNTRTPITLTINQLPVVNDLEVTFCDTLQTGTLNVNLAVYKLQINSNPANTLTFHGSPAEAL
jgi:hypothetical protein